MKLERGCEILCLILVIASHGLIAQEEVDLRAVAQISDRDKTSTGAPSETGPQHDSPGGPFKSLLVDFGQDQKAIWTSPSRIRFSDAAWLVPAGGIAAGLFVTDRQYSASLATASSLNRYKDISSVGIAGLVGADAGLYLMSFPAHNEHWRETGLLAGEAAINSLIPIEIMKYSLQRERPYQGGGSGAFFHGGASFPSEHAAVGWSIAGVVAHEYPGVLPNLLVYGAAAAIDFSRVRDRQHFPSDVFVGSLLGYLVAQSTYSRRHEPEIGGRAWEPVSGFMQGDRSRSPAFMGSPYVPLESWIYPALERLGAMGYLRTESLGLRPWTRLECARLVSEAAERQPDVDEPTEPQKLYDALAKEFASELGLMEGDRNLRGQLESAYVRATGITGQPLTDNQHFGQTILNDYGRPYQEGFNSVAGVSGWATAGPFVIYVRGEHQSAPSAPALSAAVVDFIASADGLPPNPPSNPIAAVNRFRLLDAYVGMNLNNWQLSFGKQSLWWGPGEDGGMLATNNVDPIGKMFRINRVSPFRLPGMLEYFGDIRVEFFIGQLSGQEFVKNSEATITSGQYGQSLSPQPFIDGGKISFKFTPNLEFNMSKTTIYGGPGNPLTPTTFLQSAFGVHVNGEALGDGRSDWDFTYRIPKMRDWLSLYGDVFEEDEPFPINHLEKAAFQGGLYLAKLPRFSRMDLRVEGGSTSPVDFPSCNGCYYHDFQYVNGYTNYGQALGSWLGRAAQGESIWTTYWFNPRNKLALELKHRQVDRQFLPGGGTQNDAALKADFQLKSGIGLSGTLQYESWQIPLLAAGPQKDVTASFQIGYWPRAHSR